MMNFYQLFSVSPSAPRDEIRKKYLELVIKVHPDKREQENVKNILTAMEFDFYELQRAWKTLKNPARRFEYDLQTFGHSELHPNKDESFLIHLRKTDSAAAIERLSTKYQRLVLHEVGAPKGLILTLAFYGPYEELHRASRKPLENPVDLSRSVDVLIPLQCAVEGHKLIMSGGKTSTKSNIPGFYSPILPSETIQMGLLVRYTFSGKVHQAIVLDEEPVWIPKKTHLVNINALGPGGELLECDAGLGDGAACPAQSPRGVHRSSRRHTGNRSFPEDDVCAAPTPTAPPYPSTSSSSSSFLPILKYALQAATACLSLPYQWAAHGDSTWSHRLASSALSSHMGPLVLLAACALCLHNVSFSSSGATLLALRYRRMSY